VADATVRPVWHAEFRDPRLVEVYDRECPWGPDDDYFLAQVDRVPGARVLDLGCGTGRLTVALAQAGHTVTGVDPAPASLEAARAKPGAEQITWIEGTSAVLPDAAFDVALMTSHVAQFFVADDVWRATLADLARTLVPGGLLLFDARDPRDRAWKGWNPADSRRRTALADGRVVRSWTDVTAVDEDSSTVTFTHHNEMPEGDDLVSTASLRFRSEAELRGSLDVAGFRVEQLFGGWRRQPVGAGDGELLVVARRDAGSVRASRASPGSP